MSKISDSTHLLVQEEKECLRMNKLKAFFFIWIYPLISIGKSRSLVQDDIYQIQKEYQSTTSYQKFYSKFCQQISLKQALYRAFTFYILLSFTIFFFVSIATLGTPKLTEIGQRYFIYDNLDDKPSFYSLLLFVSFYVVYLLLLSLFKPYYLYLQTILSVQIQGALQQEIIKKTLRMPLIRSQHYSIGELINMLQVDITQCSQYFQNAYQVFTLPIQLIVAGIVFFITLKEDAVLPITGAILQGVLGITFGYFYGKIQNKFMLAKDLRMKIVDETLVYSKQIKLNCLENYFEERIAEKRQKELKYLKLQVLMLIILKFVAQVIGVLTWELWFITAEQINFAKVGIMMQNYAIVVTLLENLPNQIRLYSMSSNSLSRLTLFLSQKEIEVKQIDYINPQSQSISEDILTINDASFDWKCNDTYSVENKDEDLNEEAHQVFGIENLSLTVKKGQFIAIVGNSASGKSTILRSLLRETNLTNGNMQIKGTLSVATQEPWIINGSIKENITFMTTFDFQRYKKVIKACGLEKDIASFKYGDDTILGEKGDNLSGGQQKRINLARAVYREADIYLLDDPMSALDIKVRYHIHQQCLLGFLKNKTVILFTNSLQNLQEADKIYILDQGKLIREGTFNEIKSNDSDKQSYVKEEQKQFIDLKFEEDHYSKENIGEITDLKGSLLQIEDQQKGQISKQVIEQIFTFQGRYISIVVAILYFIIVLCCQMFGNQVLASDNIPDSEFRVLALYMYPLIMLPIIIALCSMNAYFLIKGLKTSKIIHNNVIASLLKASFTKFYNTILIGRLMNRLSKDIYNIDMLFPNEMQNLNYQFTSLLLPLIASVFFFNYVVLPVLLLFFMIMIYLTIIYYRSLREITRIESVSKSPVFSFYQQIARGITFVRSAIKSNLIFEKHSQNVDLDLGNQLCLFGMQYWFQSLAGSITTLFQALLFIACYLFPGSTQKMTFLILVQMQSVSTILLALAISYGNILMYSVSFERCLHLANNIEKENYEKVTVSSGETPQDSREAISMKGCSFQYRPNSKVVLQNLDFDLVHGEKIGVVGRTGAGKSSLILALTDMIEKTQGELIIDGRPIQQYGLHDLRQKFSIIPQDPLIFMGSLKENLDPLKQYQESKVKEVCEICELFQLDSFKENNLKSEIAISGNNLSLGEKQLVCIARCLLEQKLIILVDEATASIDGPTEEKIKEIFDKYFRDAAMFTIAHKVTTIMGADRIMVMNDGKITELDDPRTLLANPNSEFKQIIDLITGAEQL